MSYYVGLDIGGTKCAAVLAEVVGDSIRIADKIRFATGGLAPDEVTARFADFVRQHQSTYDIRKIGISAGGPLDPVAGTLICPPHLPLWHGYNVVDRMQKLTGIVTSIENDANTCAIAEWKFGAGRGVDNMVFLTMGTGFGGGLILDGKLYRGVCDQAGEVGHLKITERGSFGYGKVGAAEGTVSGAGIADYAKSVVKKRVAAGDRPAILDRANGDIDAIDARLVGDMAKEGDELALKIFAHVGKYLGRVLATIIDLINPELIVIGGVYMRCEALLRPTMLKEIKKEALSISADRCRIVPAELGESVGDYSAIALCLC